MRFSTYLIAIPIVAVAAVAAIANRQDVVFSLDPFSRGAPSPALSLEIPLFLLLFAAVALGTVLGWLAAILSRLGRARAGGGKAKGKGLLPARLGGSKPPSE